MKRSPRDPKLNSYILKLARRRLPEEASVAVAAVDLINAIVVKKANDISDRAKQISIQMKKKTISAKTIRGAVRTSWPRELSIPIVASMHKSEARFLSSFEAATA